MKVGSFYGTHHFLWYFTEGIPIIMTISLPLLASGSFYVWKAKSDEHFKQTQGVLLLETILALVASLSISEHKEFRFLSPVVPLFMIL